MNPLLTAHYLDTNYFLLEQDLLGREPLCVGCKHMVPGVGDYWVCERKNQAEFLIHNQHGIELISNVCKHHQALILQNKGTIKSIICPFHRWQYSLDGYLKKAPQFAEQPCVQLEKATPYAWNNLLFVNKQPEIVSPDSLLNALVFEEYAYSNSITEQAPYNWKIFIRLASLGF